jgi:hypothetical protein
VPLRVNGVNVAAAILRGKKKQMIIDELKKKGRRLRC